MTSQLANPDTPGVQREVAPRRNRRRVSETRHEGGVRRKDNTMAYLMVGPVVILLSIFVVWPVIYAGYLSFFNWSFYVEPVFVGLRNFRNVLNDPYFMQAIWRGLRFALIVVPIQLVIAFLFASLVKAVGSKIATTLKVSIYLPTIISGVIASIIFVLIYNYPGGILNAFVGLFGMEPQAWLGDVQLALGAIAIPAIWLGTGIGALIMLAGIIDIPESYYEAARLEGANWFQQTFFITIPLLRNIILYLLIAGFTGAIQQYELPLVMTNGGPLRSTELPNLYIFNHFRTDDYVGFSIAAAFLLFIVLGSISAAIFKVLNSEKAVDG
ncbi:binding-protein-dependent transport systems inner membrane component [Beutenbergia cavernae DSM 12333]|uniref:Binding-protein-dependent transport systems inner membrane component n=1 Tax=Beutenbergia cavernae (strain ATCC BAA-8 / DSM 12333 / CCUG 43141 / JCM 11478 / NBRC 16432 / NCIMB 13614 / HKI 0122) TaxID=471853 RepID=C5C452_BEUC1|nr:sugar ABC transporter permease [Beutenbergia cavernae]ACQ79965.1 binding-protein-dependent transport systems inner membrane component [Beutenbergia cavernae DSM 12333]